MIVCGLLGVGLRTVEQLCHSGVAVVVLDADPDLRLARVVERWGAVHIHRSAHLGDGLTEAGLERAAAVICVETNELVTLEIAMRVKEARPDVRLVVQLANPAVGQALERVSGAGSVLDVAALAAPSFVEACLRQPTHDIELAGERFTVVEVVVDENKDRQSTFRGRFGNLVPVAVVPADGGEMACCPGRDQRVSAGDHVTLLGTPGDLDRSGLDETMVTRPARVSISVMMRARRRIRASMQDSSRGLILALGGLAALLVVAVLVIHTFYVVPTTHSHLDTLTSTYFAVETVATVGFGDFSFGGQGPGLQAFAIGSSSPGCRW